MESGPWWGKAIGELKSGAGGAGGQSLSSGRKPGVEVRTEQQHRARQRDPKSSHKLSEGPGGPCWQGANRTVSS